MSAIVPYAAGTLGKRYIATRLAYDNREYIGRGLYSMGRFAARRIQRAWRARGRKRRRIGERVGTSSAKANKIYFDISTPTILNTGVLYYHDVTVISEATNDDITQRSRKIINYRGFKTCISFRNVSTTPIWINLAVISPKNNVPLGFTRATFGSTSTQQDFFRAQGEGPERAVEFGLERNGLEMHCLPINTDLYTVLRHKRMMLFPNGAGAGIQYNSNRPSFKYVDFYTKINRQIRYDGTAGGDTQHSIWVVYWFSPFNGTRGFTPSADVEVQRHIVAYFREPSP